MSRLKQIVTSCVIANSNPTVTDDSSKGAYKGQRWLNGTSEYICTNPAVGAAVWTAVGGGSGVASVNTRTGAVTLAGTDIPAFVASGASHAPGAVPDPGASAGSTKFLREDATWATPAGGGAVASVNTRTGAVVLGGTDIPAFVASGASHAPGAVPDPGAGAGSTKFLREDATWATPAGGGGGKSVSSYQATVAAEAALVAYWKLNEAPGSTTLVDSASGAANPLTTVGGQTALGLRGLIPTGLETCMNCIGSVTNGICAQKTSPTAAIPVGSAARSLELIVQLTFTSFTLIAGYGSSGLRNWFGIGFGAGGAGNVYFGTYSDDIIVSDTNVLDGRPHHLVFTYDGNLTIKGYLDGKLVGTHTLGAVLTTTLSGDGFTVGTGKPFGSVSPLAQVSDVAVYNAALSAATVLDHFTRYIGAL